jgi:hypothetical protein
MHVLHIITTLVFLALEVSSQCCLKFDGRLCINCPSGTHLFRGNCILNVDNCATYKDGFDCATCNTEFSLSLQGECLPILAAPPVVTFTDVKIDPKTYKLTANDAYGQILDYLKSVKPQLVNANAIGANLRTYSNKTV